MDDRPLAQRLAETLLPVSPPLPEFVRERRTAGVPWRLISREIWDTVKIDIGEQTLRQWYPNASVADDGDEPKGDTKVA